MHPCYDPDKSSGGSQKTFKFLRLSDVFDLDRLLSGFTGKKLDPLTVLLSACDRGVFDLGLLREVLRDDE